MKLKHIFCLIFLIVLSTALNANPIKIKNMRVYKNKTFRIVFDMTAKATYKHFSLKNPNRVVIDFKNTIQAFTPKQSQFVKSPIHNMRFAKKQHNNLRIVLDLRVPCKTHSFQLNPSGKHGYRTIIDFSPLKTAKKTLPLKSTDGKTLEQKQPKVLHDIVIVLDPGHGGRDPGATGPSGTHEKKITLAIGLDLRRDLRTIPGIKVYMTRTRDVYPTLSQRLFLARRVKADLFVSIHADAYKNRSARGATVFALSRGRATSEAAHWIAERENKSELLGGVNLADKSYMLRSVLVDLSQTATIGSSLKLGRDVVNSLRRVTRMHSSRIEQASLYVLTSPDIPAILVETGFISNPYEERLLREKIHQRKVALAIKRGIYTYLIDNPIQNTIFTARIFGGKYIVKKGDTLSGIAAKFKVSESRLKQINVTNNGKIFIGQVIHVPANRK